MAPHEKFLAESGDSLGAEHALLSSLVDEAIERAGTGYWTEVSLETLETARTVFALSVTESLRLLRAALVQLRHWDWRLGELRASLKDVAGMIEVRPEWQGVWRPRHFVRMVAEYVLQQDWPHEPGELREWLVWFASTPYPLNGAIVTAAAKRCWGKDIPDAASAEALRDFAAALRRSYTKKEKRLGTEVEALLGGVGEAMGEGPVEVGQPPQPAPAGHPKILCEIKSALGMLDAEHEEESVVREGEDGFAMRADSPLARQHGKISEVIAEFVGASPYNVVAVRELAAGREMLEASPAETAGYLLAAAERVIGSLLQVSPEVPDLALWRAGFNPAALLMILVGRPVAFEREELFDFLLFLAALPQAGAPAETHASLDQAVRGIGALTGEGKDLSPGERYVLHLWRASRIQGPPFGNESPEVRELTGWIGDRARFFLVPGEAWTDRANADLAAMEAGVRAHWVKLLQHALTATGARPTARWTKAAKDRMGVIGIGEVNEVLQRWLGEVARGRTLGNALVRVIGMEGMGNEMHDENATVLRGLLWMAPLLPDAKRKLRLVADVVQFAYKKVPGTGARNGKVGNAAVYVLSEIGGEEAVGFLAMLKARVKVGTAQKEIEKAFQEAARVLGLRREEIEELGVPACGLEAVGRREERLGSYRAEIVVNGSEVELGWFDGNGKKLRSVPAAVKREHGESYSEWKKDVEDLKGLLAAQRERLESLFLSGREWTVRRWRDRYLDHPLVGTIARRLIWCVGDVALLCVEGRLLDVEGRQVVVSEEDVVRLWHPVGRSSEEVLAWRRRIEALEVVQPFKQAHRETYLLTEAERGTGTYSNRFAAHLLRQHQFHALCGARGWKNRLRLVFDGLYPPAVRELPEWGLRAEFWIEGVEGRANAAGVYDVVRTDAVRFYRMDAAGNVNAGVRSGYRAEAAGPGEDNINVALPLGEIPPLVLTEVMRDVDLFVGVASIGNDPSWQDGGGEERYNTYWESFNRAALSESAMARREILQGLLPRLKIAQRCTLTERHLEVRGEIRTYRIHLGSGNILMQPTDEYLCIVPDARTRAAQPMLYLPFEGDDMLSIVLSKAFLLAEDDKIKDPVILRQIHRKA